MLKDITKIQERKLFNHVKIFRLYTDAKLFPVFTQTDRDSHSLLIPSKSGKPAAAKLVQFVPFVKMMFFFLQKDAKRFFLLS